MNKSDDKRSGHYRLKCSIKEPSEALKKKKRPTSSPPSRPSKKIRYSQEPKNEKIFENHENERFYNEINFVEEAEEHNNRENNLNEEIPFSQKVPKQISIQVDEDDEVEEIERPVTPKARSNVISRLLPPKVRTPAPKTPEQIEKRVQPTVAHRTSPYFAKPATNVTTKDIDEGLILMNDILGKYTKLTCLEDGSLRIRVTDSAEIFDTAQGGFVRTIIFHKKYMKAQFYNTEQCIIGFKLSTCEMHKYNIDDETSVSMGYIVLIPTGPKSEFKKRMMELTRAKGSFLQGALEEDLDIHPSIQDMRDLGKQSKEIFHPKELLSSIHSQRADLEEEQDDIGSQRADLEEEEPKVIVNPNELVLEYHGITITHADLNRLNEGEFLNDNLIDLYLQFLCQEIDTKMYHLFPATFYPLLKKDVKRVSRRVPHLGNKIFDKDFLFIPVNNNLHWTLIVVCYPGFQDRCIMYCDSMGSYSGNVALTGVVQEYLAERWRLENDGQEEPPTFKHCDALLPRQPNSCDCGVFVLQYVDAILAKAKGLFPENLPIQDENLFPIEVISQKRNDIRKRILELVNK
jgi:hypothetical protein